LRYKPADPCKNINVNFHLYFEEKDLKTTISVQNRSDVRNRVAAHASVRRAFFRRQAAGLISLTALLLLIGSPALGQSGDKALFIDHNGNIGIGTDQPAAALDVRGAIHADQVNAGKLTGDGSDMAVGDGGPLKEAIDKKFDKAGGTVTGPLNVQGNVGIGTVDNKRNLEVTGVLRARTVLARNPMQHRMYPADAIIYQDIFEAKEGIKDKEGNVVEPPVIFKLGSYRSYDDHTHPRTNLWSGRPIIRYGGNQEEDGNGAKVIIPDGYNTVWLRVLGDRWNVIHAYFLDGEKEDLGLWTGGRRSANCYCPDGSLSDSYFNVHQWVPIPVGRAGELALISRGLIVPLAKNENREFWLSGVAFSKNPWAHAAQSALGYHWAVNGGDRVAWNSNNWESDVLAMLNQKTNWELKVPVVSSGRDKLLYLIEHNNNWNGCMHTGITVEGQPIERFMATYDNPFARHWNSKFRERYIAAYIPAALIPPDARWLSVRVDMRNQNNNIHFREIGTHDLDVPLDY
jgi:hypothetical protein